MLLNIRDIVLAAKMIQHLDSFHYFASSSTLSLWCLTSTETWHFFVLERQFNPFLLSANRLSNKTSDSLTVPQGSHSKPIILHSLSGAVEGDKNRAGLNEKPH